MKFNKKLIFFSLALLLLIWCGNIFYYEEHVLKEPLFIKGYHDITSDMSVFQLNYIENINSQDRVTGITFPELGIQSTDFNELDSNTGYKNYKLKLISFSLLNNYPNKIPNEYKDKLISKANISFSSGKIMNVNLGKIYFYGEAEGNEIRNDGLTQYGGSSSNDNTGSSIFRVEKDLTILSIRNKFYDEIKDILKVNINGTELSHIAFPLKLKKNDQLYINYSFTFNQNDIRKNYLFNLNFDILTANSQGNKGISSFGINANMQSPENLNINALKSDMEEN